MKRLAVIASIAILVTGAAAQADSFEAKFRDQIRPGEVVGLENGTPVYVQSLPDQDHVEVSETAQSDIFTKTVSISDVAIRVRQREIGLPTRDVVYYKSFWGKQPVAVVGIFLDKDILVADIQFQETEYWNANNGTLICRGDELPTGKFRKVSRNSLVSEDFKEPRCKRPPDEE